MKVTFIVESSRIAKVAWQPEPREQVDTLSIFQGCTGNAVDRCANPHGLKESCAIKFNGFGFHLKSLSRFVNCQQCAIIGDVRNDFYVFNVQKLWRQYSEPGRWGSKTRKGPGAQQGKQSCNL